MTAARRDDLGQRILYRIVRALILTPFKAIFLVRVRGREKFRLGAIVQGFLPGALVNECFHDILCPF